METSKIKWHSCRLVVNRDSGRIEWCVGKEKTWKTRLKYMAILPVVLLVVLLIPVALSRLTIDTKSPKIEDLNSLVMENDNSENANEDERNVVKSLKTSFVPPQLDSIFTSGRTRRNVQLPTNPEIVFTDYEEDSVALNISDGVDEDLDAQQSHGIVWQILGKSYPLVPDFKEYDDDDDDDDDEEDIEYLDYEMNLNDVFWKKKLSPSEVRKLQGRIMKRYMDPMTDPCDDFYEYACGNWARYNPIPADRAGYDTFEILRENLDSVLKDLLADESDLIQDPNYNHARDIRDILNHDFDEKKHNAYVQSVNDTLPVYFPQIINISTTPVDAIAKAKYLYKSCMDTELINKRGSQPLINLLNQLGGWPLLNQNWTETKFDWLLLVGQLRLFNNDVLISEWIGPDIKNSDEYVIQIDQTSLGLPSREYFLDDSNRKYIEAYRLYVIQIARLLGATYQMAKEGAEEIIKFETDLASIMAAPDERRNFSDLYRRMTVAEINLLIPQIDWTRYLSMIMSRPIKMEEELVCFSVHYLQKLVVLLGKTSPRIIANYLHWRFARQRVNNLDQKFQDVKQRFYYILFGREKSPPRWQNCVSQVNSNMGMSVGNLFVSKYFDEVSKNDTLYMTKEIQTAFRELLETKDWLDGETKYLAGMKIEAMRLRIGYPDFILDRAKLKERYADVIVHPDTYFENTLSILQHLTRIEQARLGVIVNKSTWNTAPAVVNAYYSRNKNQIMFPAGILQPPFYQRFFPRSLNYGGIGVVIGHEITHGFDDKGRLFDRDGNFYRWWNDDAIEQFHARAQCLIDQYSSYEVTEVKMHVDGKHTQGENISDNGGIKQAFKAYKTWLEKNHDMDESLPGINVTNTQLFFLNFAQVWCGSMRPEAARNKLKTAVHSPGRYRVIGTLSNFHDFAKEFNCPIGSPMNPAHKCSIW